MREILLSNPNARTFFRATAKAGLEISTASMLARGNASAASIARQPDPVQRSSTLPILRGERHHGLSPSSSNSAMNERGTMTRGSTKKRCPDSHASPSKYASGCLPVTRFSVSVRIRRISFLLAMRLSDRPNSSGAILTAPATSQAASSCAFCVPWPKKTPAARRRFAVTVIQSARLMAFLLNFRPAQAWIRRSVRPRRRNPTAHFVWAASRRP